MENRLTGSVAGVRGGWIPKLPDARVEWGCNASVQQSIMNSNENFTLPTDESPVDPSTSLGPLTTSETESNTHTIPPSKTPITPDPTQNTPRHTHAAIPASVSDASSKSPTGHLAFLALFLCLCLHGQFPGFRLFSSNVL